MQKNWHTISLSEVFSEAKSRKEGLTNLEANQRLKEVGRNTLPQEKPYSKIRLFLSQFHSPLMYILLTTVVISFLLKHYSDSIFIIIVLLINTIVGFFQENKANQSLLVLKKMVKIRARVWRDGNEKEIDSEELVIGDVVLLKAGDKVPADGRIIESKGLKINEASLTGESQTVEKKTDDIIPESAPLPERTNMVFMGTITEEGRATIMVVATGINTQIGEIVSLLKKTKERKTPLQQKIASLSKITGAFILSIIFAIVIIGYFTEKSFADIFVVSLALAVSAIPEGLLPAITVILALGMRRILKQNGLVRKLAATETLGSVTVICTDKTGTLTEGKMQVSHILTSTRELMSNHLNGLAKGENANGVESHISALKIATLANDAFVENPEAELQEWVVRGKPTEQALLLAGMQSGLDKKELEKQYPVLDRITFESDYKFAATFHRKDENQNMLYVIGAPEEIIAR
ncbi:MAG: HAD-IC family P-type ATPase, partial [bacterium]|nr:HAD-IC family P-type ATPase [bacterium]